MVMTLPCYITKGHIMALALNRAARRPTSSTRPGLWTLLTLWRQRRALASLDDARLDDIGLTRRDALREAQKPIWDVPRHWLRG
jgi:uncharacterized protein YjiS (DUF1127 family)